ncbi:XRE family transcriptional regulator [Mucilaginibacter endophyticus]|uniref:XRE family transcriptional regulator n=1 Tax=Mucilaginibacter endophyticus TaxID=2675003 RepID=UPI001379F5CD|nr:helix-turn-helix transcriptional regulator [Mucilaginibacter endophyticus]
MNGTELRRLRIEKGISQQELADQTGIPKGTIGRLEASGAPISKVDVLTSINKFFKIETKSNPRLEAKVLHISADPNDYDNDGSRFEELPDGTLRMRVPVIPHKAFAGYLRGFQDPEFYDGLNYISIDVFKQHRGTYLAFEVVGDSMTSLEPEHFRKSIFDGVTVVGRELAKHHWKYKLHINNHDAWIIVHKTEGILIKQIIDHNVELCTITIHSLNPDKKTYPDEVLHLDDVEQIFNVVQKVDK